MSDWSSGVCSSDLLVGNALARAVKSPAEARTQLAVVSAVRILSEREAAWPVHKLGKTALDLGLKGDTVESIERRIDRPVQNRQPIPGIATAEDRHVRMATTQEALRTEERFLTPVRAQDRRVGIVCVRQGKDRWARLP